MKRNALKISRPSEALFPVFLLIAALLGRAALALWLYIACMGVKLCALATSDGLRIAFAQQPSVRNVQGSAIVALLAQLAGAVLAALIANLTRQDSTFCPLIACGLLINIEHVFYEYLYAIGEDQSAVLYQGICCLLSLAGLLLCAPPSGSPSLPEFIEPAWLLAATGACALVGAALSLVLGGKPKPRMNVQVLRCAPVAMLQAALYPTAALIVLSRIVSARSVGLPLFCGLILYELCRAPFRRTPTESSSMNRILLVTCLAASIVAIAGWLVSKDAFFTVIFPACAAVILAAICAFALFGGFRLGRWDEA